YCRSPFAEQSDPSYNAAPAPSAYDGNANPRASKFSTPNARGGVSGSYPSVQPRASATTTACANLEPQPSAQRQCLAPPPPPPHPQQLVTRHQATTPLDGSQVTTHP
ncbi:hypothetical protein PTTG_10048, partial [Puccinia triticina 1-1 BBBD Race 1]